MTDNAFKAKDIGLRAQKKILSRMASKNVAKVFIDETTSSLLDNVYRLVKQQFGSKKDAEKLVKNIIKIVIKIGRLVDFLRCLWSNECFLCYSNSSEKQLLH